VVEFVRFDADPKLHMERHVVAVGCTFWQKLWLIGFRGFQPHPFLGAKGHPFKQYPIKQKG
jgi:hypothetical protein